MKLKLIILCAVCSSMLYGDIFAKDNESQATRRSSVGKFVKDFKDAQRISAEQGKKRIELTPKWFAAAESGDLDTMKSLYKSYFSEPDLLKKDDDGRTALEIAVENGYVKVIEWLLDHIHNADIPFNINAHTAGHKTLLAIAAANGHEDVVEVLLENRAHPVGAYDMTAEGRLRSALMIAANKGYTGIVKLLLNTKNDPLRHSADVNEQDYDGRTALILAVMQDHLDTAKLLLDHGAKIKIKDKKKKTALDYAEGNSEMTELLAEYVKSSESKKEGKNVFKRAWNKVVKKTDHNADKKADSKNRRLSADSEATLYGDETEAGHDIDDIISLSTDTLVDE